MEEAGKLIGMAIAGGLFAMIGRFMRDRWKHNTESRAQESRLSLDESKEQQALSQQSESYNLKEMKAFARERQKVHESDMAALIERTDADKREILGHLGNVSKELKLYREEHTQCRIIQVRMLEFMKQKYQITDAEIRDLFRPVEMWEKVEDDKRVEESQKREDDSVY